MRVPRYRTVVFDVDSTLTGIEGVDWLAARRSPEIAAAVQQLTEQVTSGELPLEAVYAARLEQIEPTRDEVAELAAAYRDAVAPDARPVLASLMRSRVRVVAMSGGLRDAVLPFCTGIGFAEADVHAVPVEWTARGRYAGFDRSSPLTMREGKATLLGRLALPRPLLAVGDGSTDLAMRLEEQADAFAVYAGFTRRDPIVQAADVVVATFGELLEYVEGRR